MLKKTKNIFGFLAIIILAASCDNLGQIKLKENISVTDKTKPSVSSSATSTPTVVNSESPVPTVSPVSSPSVIVSSPNPVSIKPPNSIRLSPSTTPLTNPLYKAKPTRTPVPTVRKSITPTPQRSSATKTPLITTTATPVFFANIKPIISRRCLSCHSSTTASDGVILETEEQIKLKSLRIRQRVVFEQTMPDGNATNITQQERDLIGKWVDGGSQ